MFLYACWLLWNCLSATVQWIVCKDFSRQWLTTCRVGRETPLTQSHIDTAWTIGCMVSWWLGQRSDHVGLRRSDNPGRICTFVDLISRMDVNAIRLFSGQFSSVYWCSWPTATLARRVILVNIFSLRCRLFTTHRNRPLTAYDPCDVTVFTVVVERCAKYVVLLLLESFGCW